MEEFNYIGSFSKKMAPQVEVICLKDPKFAHTLTEFLVEVDRDCNLLNAKKIEAEKCFLNVCSLFGEDPCRTKPEEVLQSFTHFLKTFDNYANDYKRRKEIEMQKRKRKAVSLSCLFD